MTELLFNDVTLIFFIVFTTVIAVVSIMYASTGRDVLDSSTQAGLYLLGLISAVCLVSTSWFMLQIKFQPVYSGDWKRIYTNDENLELTLDLNNASFKTGSELGESYTKLNFSYWRDGKVIATDAAGFKETRSIRLKAEDVKADSDMSPKSKITKVEYRPVKGRVKTALGLTGPEEKVDYDGELRITISTQEKSEELKKLFD